MALSLPADVARLLNHLGYTWKYEKTHIQTEIGTYIPDFTVDFNGKNYIIEVKGQWVNRSVSKCWDAITDKEFKNNEYLITD